VIPPFFIVGCARSGTTLLRLVLASHSEIAIPPESFFVGRNQEYLKKGALSHREARKLLQTIYATDSFKDFGLDTAIIEKQIFSKATVTYLDIICTIFDTYARQHGKKRWGDKTTSYVFEVDFLVKLFPASKFIVLIRDGRDVAVSLSKIKPDKW